MKILVEPNAHNLVNVGDIAMLQVNIRRLRERWPDATIGVITDAPAALARYCPGTSPVSAAGRRIWFGEALLTNRLLEMLPARGAAAASRLGRVVRRTWPRAARSIIATKCVLKREPVTELDSFFTAMTSADLLVVSGAGAITDAFAPLALTILDLLDFVVTRGTPTAILGQGIGPISDRALYDRAGDVLPKVRVIGIRERLHGQPLLRSLGVPADRIFDTGDDAVELAVERASLAPGTAVGVSIRIARYSGMDDETLASIRGALAEIQNRYETEFVGLPVSRYWKERDAEVIAALLPGEAEVSEPIDAVDIIERIGGCRVVIAGSYHAAVFALSQGVPVVALAASDYYVWKFEGLADEFGGGCTIVQMAGAGLSTRLATAFERTWDCDENLREHLRAIAASQVARSRSAYDAIFNAVSGA
jgi:polysaccharide pyruvyl transferase WcaK-like protein